MNRTKQFWALVKFQALMYPFIIFPVLIFALMPIWIPMMNPMLHDYHPSLSPLLMNDNLFYVGIVCAIIVAPGAFQYGTSSAWSSGTEFMLTRAVDRPIYFRARSFFYYALVLVIPLIVLLTALFRPELQIDEYHPTTHREILAQLPDSIAAPVDKRGVSTGITLPWGNVLVAGWHLSAFILAAGFTQAILVFLYPFKYRRWIAYSLYMALCFWPIFLLLLGGKTSTNDPPTWQEMAFLYFATHQVVLWIEVLAIATALHLWCERRIARMEF